MISVEGEPPPKWEELYRSHHRSVLTAATFAAGGDVQAGLDGLQQAFLRAGERLKDPAATPIRNWAAWLRKVAVRHVVQARADGARLLSLDGHDQPDRIPTLDSWVFSREEYRTLLKIISAMPVRRRQAFALRYIAGYTVGETALIMDSTEANVRNLIHLVRKELPVGSGRETADERA
ncbi:RNA polymerase sigma factor [Streptomyces sp. NPDC054932]